MAGKKSKTTSLAHTTNAPSAELTSGFVVDNLVPTSDFKDWEPVKKREKGKNGKVHAAQPQLYADAWECIIRRHLGICSTCKMHGLQCQPACPEEHFERCQACIRHKRSYSPCQHREWLNTKRVKERALLKVQGRSELVADCFTFGKTFFFGDARHNKASQEYWSLS